MEQIEHELAVERLDKVTTARSTIIKSLVGLTKFEMAGLLEIIHYEVLGYKEE